MVRSIILWIKHCYETLESMLGYDLSNAGKQNIAVTTKGKTCRFEIYVTDEAEYVTDSLISNYSGYTANPGVNKNCDGGELNIAGKQCLRLVYTCCRWFRRDN